MNNKKFYVYTAVAIIAGIGLFFYDKKSFYDYIKIMGTGFFVCLFFVLQQHFFKKKNNCRHGFSRE
ncbi:hypothetical protein HMPREF9466_01749 [Fusobacterium necrophorum subsp. funduliforme 1_1_36S]|nr:hypothetical protein HMPREF9466_01749 [Fusobacterium necrophorum subsp. funduliforme 1_1_36S]